MSRRRGLVLSSWLSKLIVAEWWVHQDTKGIWMGMRVSPAKADGRKENPIRGWWGRPVWQKQEAIIPSPRETTRGGGIIRAHKMDHSVRPIHGRHWPERGSWDHRKRGCLEQIGTMEEMLPEMPWKSGGKGIKIKGKTPLPSYLLTSILPPIGWTYQEPASQSRAGKDWGADFKASRRWTGHPTTPQRNWGPLPLGGWVVTQLSENRVSSQTFCS